MSEELPQGWASASFTEVFDIQGGTQPPKSTFKYEPTDGYVRLLQIRDFGSKPVPTFIRKKPTVKTCKKDDVLIGRYGASVGRICTGMEGAYNVALAKVVIPEQFERRFVFHLLRSPLFQRPILDIERSAQDGFNKEDLAEIILPLPPLGEQRRIVAKLEKLLGKVDACQQRLSKIPVLLKRFRQSVVAAACSGRLTADWREENSQEDWRGLTIKNATTDISYGYTAKASQDTSGVKYLRITDIQNGKVNWHTVPYCNIPSSRIGRYLLTAGDIVFARTGATTGKSFLIGSCPKVVFASYLIRVRPNDLVTPEFLYLFFQSDDYWQQVSENISGSAQPNCNATKLAGLAFMLPSLAEQQEIVRRVDALFALADELEARYAKAKAHVDKLTQSILAKAFRGELVPQDPNDEPASVLLERISQNRNSCGKASQKRSFGTRRLLVKD